MKSYEEMARRVLERRDAALIEKKRKKRLFIKWTAAAAAMCAVTVIGVKAVDFTGHREEFYNPETTTTTTTAATDSTTTTTTVIIPTTTNNNGYSQITGQPSVSNPPETDPVQTAISAPETVAGSDTYTTITSPAYDAVPPSAEQTGVTSGSPVSGTPIIGSKPPAAITTSPPFIGPVIRPTTSVNTPLPVVTSTTIYGPPHQATSVSQGSGQTTQTTATVPLSPSPVVTTAAATTDALPSTTAPLHPSPGTNPEVTAVTSVSVVTSVVPITTTAAHTNNSPEVTRPIFTTVPAGTTWPWPQTTNYVPPGPVITTESAVPCVTMPTYTTVTKVDEVTRTSSTKPNTLPTSTTIPTEFVGSTTVPIHPSPVETTSTSNSPAATTANVYEIYPTIMYHDNYYYYSRKYEDDITGYDERILAYGQNPYTNEPKMSYVFITKPGVANDPKYIIVRFEGDSGYYVYLRS